MYLGCHASSCGEKVSSHLANFMLTNNSLGGYFGGLVVCCNCDQSIYDAFLILLAIPLKLFVSQKSLKRRLPTPVFKTCYRVGKN